MPRKPRYTVRSMFPFEGISFKKDGKTVGGYSPKRKAFWRVKELRKGAFKGFRILRKEK